MTKARRDEESRQDVGLTLLDSIKSADPTALIPIPCRPLTEKISILWKFIRYIQLPILKRYFPNHDLTAPLPWEVRCFEEFFPKYKSSNVSECNGYVSEEEEAEDDPGINRGSLKNNSLE